MHTYRNGEVIDRALLKTILRMLCDLQVSVSVSGCLSVHACVCMHACLHECVWLHVCVTCKTWCGLLILPWMFM